MGARDDLLIGGNDVLRCGPTLIFVFSRQSSPNIIDAFKYDQPANASLCQDIPIETRKCVWPKAVSQKSIAAYAMIQHSNAAHFGQRLKPVRKKIRPAVIAIRRRSPSIG